jgi:hypothetical protein
VAKSVARQLATAVLWVRIQTSLKNQKIKNGRHKHSSPPKKYTKKIICALHFVCEPTRLNIVGFSNIATCRLCLLALSRFRSYYILMISSCSCSLLHACSSGCSQLLVLLLKLLTFCHCSHFVRNIVPTVHHSHTEEVSSDLHSPIARVGCATSRSRPVRCHFKPLRRVKSCYNIILGLMMNMKRS